MNSFYGKVMKDKSGILIELKLIWSFGKNGFIWKVLRIIYGIIQVFYKLSLKHLTSGYLSSIFLSSGGNVG